jgi:hypothetical protein
LEAGGPALSFSAHVEKETCNEVLALVRTLLSKSTVTTLRAKEMHPGVDVPAESVDFAEFLKDTRRFHQKRVRLKGYYFPATEERPYPCLAVDKDGPISGAGAIDLATISSFAPDAKTLAWPKESKLLEVEGSFNMATPGRMTLGSRVGRLEEVTRISPVSK